MMVWEKVKKVSLGGMFVGAMMLASSVTMTGCLTDDKDDDKPTAKDTTIIKMGTVGAQSNSSAGSFLELDAWKVLKVSEVTSSNAPDIDLVFAYSTSQNAAAFYSPDSAAGGIGGSAGFDFVKNALGSNAASTDIRTINQATYDGIITTEDLDAAWAAAAGSNTKARFAVTEGSAFIAESTQGKKVAILVTDLTASATGSASIEGNAKW